MANQSTPYTTTLGGTSWSYSGSAIPPGDSFLVPFGESKSGYGLPAGGAFVTQNEVTNRGTLSKSPGLAQPPEYRGTWSGSLTTNFDPPITATPSTSVPHGGVLETWENADTFYDLTAVSFTAETMTITFYLDDPAEGAEGAQAMLMIAGGM